MKDKSYWQGFHYRARLERCIDGDTLVVWSWIHPKQKQQMTLRFGRINAPEVRGAEKLRGLISKEALKRLLEGVEEILIWFEEYGSFRRYLAELYIQRDGSLININDWLVKNGFAGYSANRNLDSAGWIVEF